MATAKTESVSVQFAEWKDLYKTEKPFMLFMDLPKDAKDQRTSNVDFAPLDVQVNDIRGEEQTYAIDSHGFKIAKLEDPERFVDPATIEPEYLPALEKLLRQEVEGVDRVFFFDWRRRNAGANANPDDDKAKKSADDGRNQPLRPANTAHVDQAPIAALNRVKDQLGDEAEELFQGRIRIINIWRPVRNPVLDWPLAVCDGTTIDKNNFLDVDQVRENHIGSSMFMMRNDRMKWYYLREQKPNEVLLFKQFDSKDDVKARFCPHTAFKHNVIPEDAPPRESVEVRALVFTYKDKKAPKA